MQHLWNFKINDYIFDPADGEARIWFGYPLKECNELVWLPRQDQLQEMCIEFFIINLKTSRHEAFFHFLGWPASCLKESHDIGRDVEECEEIFVFKYQISDCFQNLSSFYYL
jgi:hypothetical protein